MEWFNIKKNFNKNRAVKNTILLVRDLSWALKMVVAMSTNKIKDVFDENGKPEKYPSPLTGKI